jgi:tRNA dimethylallyltransferase
MPHPKLILIAGPTAAGKSARAQDIAQREKGVIINADAMQVYGGLPILTNQPDAKARQHVPHLLFGTVDPTQRFSVGKWRTAAIKAIGVALGKKETPILVGGTGLYFKALLEGLADIPDVPEDIRLKTEAHYTKVGEDTFRAELATLDPESVARIAKNDRQRLVRAFAVGAHTGKSLTYWQERDPEIDLPDDLAIEEHLLMPPREELYAACDKRFVEMIDQGAVDEVRTFLMRNLDPDLPVMKTIGLREIGAHVRNEISLAEAIAKAQQATRNYAKRQMTWFRGQGMAPLSASD